MRLAALRGSSTTWCGCAHAVTAELIGGRWLLPAFCRRSGVAGLCWPAYWSLGAMLNAAFFRDLPALLNSTWPRLRIQVRVAVADGAEYTVSRLLGIEDEHISFVYHPDNPEEILDLREAPWIQDERIEAPGYAAGKAWPAVALPYALIRQVRLIPGKGESDPLGFRGQ